MIPYLLWALVPKRYVVGAAIGAALLVSGLVVYKRHVSSVKDTAYSAGYTRARDSVWVVAIRQRQIIQDSLEALAARSAKAASDGTTALVPQRAKFDSAIAKSHGVRLEPLPDSFARVPTADKVRVIVESVPDTVDDVPRRAAVYWFRADSMLGVAQRLLDKYAAANRAWSEAWRSENEARIGADSLVALYAERLRSATAPPKQSHAKRDAVYATIGAVVALVARNQIHR